MRALTEGESTFILECNERLVIVRRPSGSLPENSDALATTITLGAAAGCFAPRKRCTAKIKCEAQRAMKIERRFTNGGTSAAYAEHRVPRGEERRSSNPNGEKRVRARRNSPFRAQLVARWPADVLAQKYFRKAGVPARLTKVEEEAGVPSGSGVRSRTRQGA